MISINMGCGLPKVKVKGEGEQKKDRREKQRWKEKTEWFILTRYGVKMNLTGWKSRANVCVERD